MKATEMDFKEVIGRVSKINATLRHKGYKEWEIDAFWTQLIRLAPFIQEKGIENARVCTGCGHFDIEAINSPHLACCPDSSYVPILENL